MRVRIFALLTLTSSLAARGAEDPLRPLTEAELAARAAIHARLTGNDPEGERAAHEAAEARQDAKKLGTVPSPLERRTLEVGGQEREYFLFVPEQALGRPAPVVFGLHGGAANSGLSQHEKSDYTGVAASEGFVVVYPSGLRGWNYNPQGASTLDGERKTADDFGFFDAICDQLIAQGIADRSRIYVTGGSAGGMMTWSLMHHRGDRIAAVGIMVATLPRAYEGWPPPPRPMPTILMLGTLDPLVTWDGGPRLLSAADTVRYLTGKNGCQGQPGLGLLPDREPNDGIRVETATWSHCRAPVVLYRMNGHGHGWPMVEDNQSGPKTRDFVPIEELWPFLKEHSL